MFKVPSVLRAKLKKKSAEKACTGLSMKGNEVIW